MELEDLLNQRDNETKLLIAEMSSGADIPDDSSKDDLQLKIRKLDEEMSLKRSQHQHKVNQDNRVLDLKKEDLSIKRIQKSSSK